MLSLPTAFHLPITNKLLTRLFFITLIGKSLTAVFLLYLWINGAPNFAHSRIGLGSGDTFSYLEPIDHYIDEGEYYSVSPWKENIHKGEKAYAGRMPYYGIVYYAFRTFASPELAKDLMVVLQIFLESLSIVILALISYKTIKTRFAFWATYFLLMFTLFSTNWSLFLMPESLSISFLIFFLYFYQQYLTDAHRSYRNLFWAGFFLAMVVALKPYYIVLYLIVGLEFVWYHRRNINLPSLQDTFLRSLAVSSVLILLLLPWTIRNYQVLNKFVPLQSAMNAEYGFSRSQVACYKFIQAWGGNIMYWYYKAAGCYFIPYPETVPCEVSPPEHAFSASYSLIEVENTRNKYLRLQNSYSDSLDTQVAAEFDQLTALYKKDRPFQYFVAAPLRLTKGFLWHATSHYLPINPGYKIYKTYHELIRKSQSALYYFTLIFGFAGLIYLTRKNGTNFIFLSIPLLLVVLFPVMLRLMEWRYFIHSYPVLVLGTVASMDYLLKKINSTKILAKEMVGK